MFEPCKATSGHQRGRCLCASALVLTLAAVFWATALSANDDPMKDARYFVFPVQTDLQRELVPAKTDVLVLLDTTAALEGGKVALRELKLADLRKALLTHKKADTKLNFTLFFKRNETDESDHQEALRYALIGFGHDASFSKVVAYGSYQNTDISWKEFSARFSNKPRQPNGPEKAIANDLIKAYPVRTELSRYLTSDADCAVVVLPSLEKDRGLIPKKVRDAAFEAVGKLKIPHKKRISFVLTHVMPGNEREQLLNEFHKLAEDMKFEASSVAFR